MDEVLTPMERKVIYLKLSDILPNRFQPRIKFDEQALNELSESIKQHGVLSPITVRPLGNKYEIIAGERRYKATEMAGLEQIPALVVTMDDKESAEIALIENVQRKDLTPIEEAISYKKIFDMNMGISQEELAKKIGKSQPAIANKLRLLNLSDEVQEALLDNKISERHARSLLKIKDSKIQTELLNRIISERLTVRKTDEVIINMLNNHKDVEILDFELEDEPVSKEVIIDPLKKFENLFNLPKTQIVEDKEDEFIPNIPEVKFFGEKSDSDLDKTIVLDKDKIKEAVNDNNINLEALNSTNENEKVNPGFLDINQIEKNATDINKPAPKLSLEELLRIPSTPVNNITNEPTKNQEIQSNNIFDSKFFNISEAENTAVVSEPIIENNNRLDETIVKQESQNSIAETENRFFKIVENDNGDVSFEPDSKNDFNFDGKFIPQEDSIFNRIEKEENKKEEEEKKSFGFSQDIFKKPIESIDSIGIDSSNVNKEGNFENLMNSLNFNNEIINDEEIDDTENEYSPTLQFKPVAPLDYKPVYDLEEDSNESNVLDNVQGIANMPTVINTIRKCAETIEKFGYVIDTEEFDFENMYQVIFKIEKK